MDIHNSKDSLGQQATDQGTTYQAPVTTAGAAMISLLLIFGSFLPTQAHAGVIDDFMATFRKDTKQSEVVGSTTGNVQTMSLPRPALNANPAVAKGGGDITVVDGALVPSEGPSGTLADIEKPKNGIVSVYIVRKGDTISEIAELFGVTANTIRWANDIGKNDRIKIGDTLVILPVTGTKHVVTKGDSLAKIAKKYGTSVEDISSYNGVDDETLAVGSTIIVPDGEIAYVEPPAPVKKPGTKKPGTATKNVPRHIGPDGNPFQVAYFASPLLSYTKTQGIHGWNGVDLAAPTGAPVSAAAPGRVVIAREGGWNGGYGSYVVIEHENGAQTLYAHMSGVTTYVGATVAQNETIGFVGSTGKSSGSHLHFEIRNGIRNPF